MRRGCGDGAPRGISEAYLERLTSGLRTPIVVGDRDVVDAVEAQANGLRYRGLGQASQGIDPIYGLS